MGQLLNPTFPKQKNANVVMVTICSVSITPSLFSRLLSELRIYGWQKLPPYFKKADYNLRSLQFFVKLIKTYYPCTCLAVFTKGLKKRTCFANFCNSNEVKQRWSLKPCLNKKMSGIQFHLPWKTSHNSPIYARLTQQSDFGPGSSRRFKSCPTRITL